MGKTQTYDFSDVVQQSDEPQSKAVSKSTSSEYDFSDIAQHPEDTTKSKSEYSIPYTALRSAEKGLIGEMGSVAAGGLAAGKESINDILEGHLPDGVSEAYRKRQQEYSSEIEKAQKANPITANIAEYGTALAPLILTGGAALAPKLGMSASALLKAKKIADVSPANFAMSKAAQIGGKLIPATKEAGYAKKIASGVASGAAAGSVGGAIYSKGTLEDEASRSKLLSDIKTGSVVGGAMGGVAGGLGAKADKLNAKHADDLKIKEFELNTVQQKKTVAEDKLNQLLSKAEAAQGKLSQDEKFLLDHYQNLIKSSSDEIAQKETELQNLIQESVQSKAGELGKEKATQVKTIEEQAQEAEAIRTQAQREAGQVEEKLATGLEETPLIEAQKEIKGRAQGIAKQIIQGRSNLSTQYGEKLKSVPTIYNLENFITSRTNPQFLEVPEIAGLLKSYNAAGINTTKATAQDLQQFLTDLRALKKDKKVLPIVKNKLNDVYNGVNETISEITGDTKRYMADYSKQTFDKFGGKKFAEFKNPEPQLTENIEQLIRKAESTSTTPDAIEARQKLNELMDYLGSDVPELAAAKTTSSLPQSKSSMLFETPPEQQLDLSKTVGGIKDLKGLISSQQAQSELTSEAAKIGPAKVAEKQYIEATKGLEPKSVPTEDEILNNLVSSLSKDQLPQGVSLDEYKRGIQTILGKGEYKPSLAPAVRPGMVSEKVEWGEFPSGVERKLVGRGIEQTLEKGQLSPALQEEITASTQKGARALTETPYGVSQKDFESLMEGYGLNPKEIPIELKDKLFKTFFQKEMSTVKVPETNSSVTNIIDDMIKAATLIPGTTGSAARTVKKLGEWGSNLGRSTVNVSHKALKGLSQNPALSDLTSSLSEAIDQNNTKKQNALIFLGAQQSPEVREELRKKE